MWGGLILSGNTLYGTAQQGSSSGAGTVFSLSLPLPKLTITTSGANVVLSWPTDAPGVDYSTFILKCTVDLDSANWSTVSALPPVIVNGRYTVTTPNNLSSHRSYRLEQ